MKTITIHKNLRNGLWSVGAPVIYGESVLAFGVSFPEPHKMQRNKQFRACLAGGPRKVFAKARCENVYSIGVDGSVNLFWEGRERMGLWEIIDDFRASGGRLHKVDGYEVTRIYFNPKAGDGYFTTEGRRNEALIYSGIVLFADDGNAYQIKKWYDWKVS